MRESVEYFRIFDFINSTYFKCVNIFRIFLNYTLGYFIITAELVLSLCNRFPSTPKFVFLCMPPQLEKNTSFSQFSHAQTKFINANQVLHTLSNSYDLSDVSPRLKLFAFHWLCLKRLEVFKCDILAGEDLNILIRLDISTYTLFFFG